MKDSGKDNSELEQGLVQSKEPSRVQYLHEIDPRKLKPIPRDFMCMEREAIPTEFIVQVVSIVASIATLMSAATTFTKGVAPNDIENFGAKKFEVMKYILTLYPLLFAVMIIPIVNNKRSIDTYYDLLSHGAIVDFPDSESFNYMATHLQPVTFIVMFLAYFVFSGILLATFMAPITIWIIFYKQFILEIVLFWKDSQNVEDDLISLTKFLEAFDDRSNEPIIDSYTLQRAATVVGTLKTVRSRASYGSYAGTWGLRRNEKSSWTLNLLMFAFISVLIVCALAQFWTESESEASEIWGEKISPCTQVCFDRARRDEEACYSCLCDCVTAFNIDLTDMTSACEQYLNVPGCDNADVCPPGPTHNCQKRDL